MEKGGERGLVLFVIVLILNILISCHYVSSLETHAVNVTAEHPFLLSNGEYVAASELKEGMQLKTSDGKIAVVKSVKGFYSEKPADVFNLEVKEYSNFVLPGNVVVHNSNVIEEGIELDFELDLIPTMKKAIVGDNVLKGLTPEEIEHIQGGSADVYFVVNENGNPVIINGKKVVVKVARMGEGTPPESIMRAWEIEYSRAKEASNIVGTGVYDKVIPYSSSNGVLDIIPMNKNTWKFFAYTMEYVPGKFPEFIPKEWYSLVGPELRHKTLDMYFRLISQGELTPMEPQFLIQLKDGKLIPRFIDFGLLSRVRGIKAKQEFEITLKNLNNIFRYLEKMTCRRIIDDYRPPGYPTDWPNPLSEWPKT